ncbi:MAG: carboxylate--amine ligase [Syntrophomonas sp.]|nr:carboxylate--amine ligase [Syntrophomonas sp.]
MIAIRLLVLGAGRNQINTIRKAKAKGHVVVVSDYLPDAPGKALADFAEMTSTFDIEGNVAVARQYQVDGIMTVGTDQPVLTAARVAEALNLPHLIDSATALRATNKKYMKEAFRHHSLPSGEYLLVGRGELEQTAAVLDKLGQLVFPVVVKPIDSQGQRGVFKLEHREPGIIAYLRETFRHTRAEEIIAEQFCPGAEITISAWVVDYHPYMLIITDRPLLNVEPRLGIMTAHQFPSVYTRSHYDELQDLLMRTVLALNIAAGPIYVQVIISPHGAQLVEIACRIGGGHEEELIPLVTGVDPVDMLIDASLGLSVDLDGLRRYRLLDNPHYAETRFIMAYPGQVQSWGGLEQIRQMPGIAKAQFYYPQLTHISEIEDSATSRWGYIMAVANSRQDLQARMGAAYQQLEILDPEGRNLVRMT